MKFKRLLMLSGVLLFGFACGDITGDDPGPLRLMPGGEVISIVQNKQYLTLLEKLRLKDEHNQLITKDSFIVLDQSGNYFPDFFLNEENEIVEVRLRKLRAADKFFLSKMPELSNSSAEIRILDVDCSRQKPLLAAALKRDQEVRINGIVSDFNANRDNLELLVSIIEKCGMPTLEEVDSLHMDAVWQIFQHAAGQKYRKKYFYQLKAAARRGDLDAIEVAQMEDRILVADGQPQRYGTYLRYDWPSKTYELYDLEAPELVDSRRAEVGLGPINEFLKEYQVDFSIAQIH